MQLQELLQLVKKNFLVDDELRAFIYKGKIEFIDYNEPVYQNGNKIMEDFYGLLCVLYFDEKTFEITSIEPSCLRLITKVNCNLYSFLASLIGQYIDDINSYPRLPSISDLDYQSC